MLDTYQNASHKENVLYSIPFDQKYVQCLPKWIKFRDEAEMVWKLITGTLGFLQGQKNKYQALGETLSK